MALVAIPSAMPPRICRATLDATDIDRIAGGLIQEMMASLKLMNEILSNVSKTRSEISMTFARNARA
jgi:hypothetical protein